MSRYRLEQTLLPEGTVSGAVQSVTDATMRVATRQGLVHAPLVSGVVVGDRVTLTKTGWIKSPKKETLLVYYV